MTISERIFELLALRNMTQKEFALRTSISESSISDWKRKKTNPVSEKILIICEVLEVTHYELLGGTEGVGRRSNPSQTYVIEKDSDVGRIVEDYLSMDKNRQGRLMGYMKALLEFLHRDDYVPLKYLTIFV